MKKERFVDWWKQDKRYMTLLKAVLMALLPLLCCLVRTAAEGRSIGQVYLPSSEWNDELFYFKQVEGIVNYGFPRGYFGFNESHALQLSFAAWSPVLVFPWILWGLLFGWNLLSPVICNIVLLTITMFVFVWLVKPTWKQLGILTVLFSLYSLFVRYMLSGMPEVICFSLLILFYGLAMSYLKKESRGKLIAMLVISVLLTLMRPYMLLFLALACYFWICRNKKAGWIGSILIVAATGITYALIKHYLGAEYFTPLFYTDWITTFFTDGIGAGFRNLFGTLYWKGLEFYRHCIEGGRNGLASGAFFDGYLLVLLILLVQSFLDIRTLRRAKRVERIAMEPEDKNVREALFGPYTLTEDRKRGLHNQLVIEVHFALSLIATYAGGFNMLASYNLQSTFSGYSFYNAESTPWVIGAILAVLVGYCVMGGGKRIIKFTSTLVPFMGGLYVLVSLVVLVMNIGNLLYVLVAVVGGALALSGVVGNSITIGVIASFLQLTKSFTQPVTQISQQFNSIVMMYGIKRGLYSNEAGVGSAPNAAASANVSHPVKQGLVQMLSVFIDTLLICSATAFMLLCSGVEPAVELQGAPYVQSALAASLIRLSARRVSDSYLTSLSAMNCSKRS